VDLSSGASADCNANFIPDECEVADGTVTDCDQDGVLDSCTILSDPANDCDQDGLLDACQILADATLDQNSNGVLDSCECFVSNYCISTANTTNQPALIGVLGIPSLSMNNFVLRAGHLPPGEAGIFYFGPLEQNPPIPFGDGFRCVGGNTVRLYPPLVIPSNGSVFRAINFTQSPTNGFTPGQTAYFQFWYRDHPAVGGYWNLSDALEVTFCP
jgi:hypothetical protein